MVNVNVGAATPAAAAAGSSSTKTRFVTMSILIGGGPVNKKLWPTNLTTTNFTMPCAAAPQVGGAAPTSAAGNGAGSSIEVRILVDDSMVELFVAKGRGVITQSLYSSRQQGLGGKGVYFMGGAHGPATIAKAAAWDMGWEPCGAA
jgi:hypothetical protein